MFKHFLNIALVELKKQGGTFLLSLVSSILASWVANTHSKDFVPKPDHQQPETPDVSNLKSLFSNFGAKQ